MSFDRPGRKQATATEYFEFHIALISYPIYNHNWTNISTIQGVTGGTDQTSGECSLGETIPI